MRKLISNQALFTAAVALLAVVVFNLSSKPLPSDLAVDFNRWYTATAPILEQTVPSDPSALANVKLSVTIQLIGRPTPPPTLTWILPARSLTENQDRSNTARALQLVRESDVFTMPPVSAPKSDASYLVISVRDGDKQFNTTVPASEIEKRIQLQNLLKLLDVFSKSETANPIEPSRT